MIEAVVFDVGETLVDETRAWSAWADHLGVPRLASIAIERLTDLPEALENPERRRRPRARLA